MVTKKTNQVFGNLIVHLDLATQEQVNKCLKMPKAGSGRKSLGSIMVAKGCITPEQHQIVTNIQKRNVETQAIQYHRIKEDHIFGRLTVQLGFAQESQVDECLGMQTMQEDYFLRLSDLMLTKGYLTQKQIQQTLDYQARQIITCPDCKTEYNVMLFKPDAKFLCYKCEQKLTVPPLPKSL